MARTWRVQKTPSFAFVLGTLDKAGEGSWRGAGIREGRCPNARKQPPRPSPLWLTQLLCVSIFRGSAGSLSVLVAAWESPLGKVLKIHSIVVYY